VIYTDDASWRKPIPDTFWYAFSSKNKKQYCHFDVIKVNSEKSGDLIKKHSLMCKLLALKANDSDVDSKALIYEIYKYIEDTKNELTNEEKLLAEQWVQAYKKVPEFKRSAERTIPRPMFFSPAAKTPRHPPMLTSAALTTEPSPIISAKAYGMFRALSLGPSFSNTCAPL
jgi:hypothetical protein